MITLYLILSPNAGTRYEGGRGQKLASSLEGNINIVIMYTADTYLAVGCCTLCDQTATSDAHGWGIANTNTLNNQRLL